MSEPIDLSLIFPAYNECATIGGTVVEAFAYFKGRNIQTEIIVAADGMDGTRELVAQMASQYPRLKVIGHPERRGKGRGIREAVEIANGKIIGYADADRKVPIEDFERIEPFLREGYRVVAGSRAMQKSEVLRSQPWFRQLGSAGFYYYMQAIVGLPGIRDTQCGFKFFDRKAARQLFHFQEIDGYMFDVEILALARRFGFSVKEVPIRWRDDGDSRLNIVSGNLRNALDIFQIRRSMSRLDRASVASRVATLELEEATCVHSSPAQPDSSAATC